MSNAKTTAYHEAVARQQQHTHTVGELQAAGLKLPLSAWLPTSHRLAAETRAALSDAIQAQDAALATLSRPAR